MEALFTSRGADLAAVIAAADARRANVVGEAVTYVINRNINYTNICLYKCGFCAFSKGSSASAVRGPAYASIWRRSAAGRRRLDAPARPRYACRAESTPTMTANTYLAIVAAVETAAPAIHIHAFSPLEITHGAKTLGLTLEEYLARLRAAGLVDLAGHRGRNTG